VVSAAPPVLYRITAAADAADEDFFSQEFQHLKALNNSLRPRAIPDDGEGLHMWSGVSVYDSEEMAHATMQRYPKTGTFIVRLQVPPHLLDNGTMRLEKTGAHPAHWTLWGRPDALRRCVQSH
jgi:hypothetical protein